MSGPNIEALYSLVHANGDEYAGIAANGPEDVTVMVVAGPTANRAATQALTRAASGAVAAGTAGVDATGTALVSIGSGTMRTRAVGRSLTQLLALQTALNDEIVAGKRPGLVGTGVDVLANKVEVYSPTPDQVRPSVEAAYPDQVLVKYGTEGTAASGRQSDSDPFYGGGRIKRTTDGRACTSGFRITGSDGVGYMVTAGHCFAQNDTVYNGTGSASLGKVTFRRYGSDNLDNELISGASYSARIFTGSTTSTTSIPVKSLGYSCGYCNVYFNGSFTGQSLGKIDSSDPSIGTCFLVSGDYSCGIVKVSPTSGTLCGSGDSGSPVFATNGSGGAIAIGIDQSYFSDGSCGYTILGRILGYWGATLTTG
ncbi:hypothetical protein V3N99_19075 [Dermatophilaceae bacterium Soc4.6]